MGIFCMIFGVVLFLGSVGGSVMLSDALLAPVATFGGNSYAAFIGLPTNPMLYIVALSFIGFLLGFSFFMKGVTYQKLCRIANRRSRRAD